MSVQDDKEAGQDDNEAGQEKDQQEEDQQEDDQKVTEKPEPDEGHKETAAEMMKAYKDQATVVLPGSGGMVSGTAVNDWLDEDGNPQHQVPDEDEEDSDKGSEEQAQADEGRDEEAMKEQIEKDKALNEELRAASAEENKGEKR